jgi:TonB-dependent receptor
VLPAATLTWRIIEDVQLRAGYNRTLNRPDLRELSSAKYYDIVTSAEYVGNSDLKRALIDSYDSRLEWYYTSDETFSVAGFYKKFHDPIESVRGNTGEVQYTLQNTDQAKLYGIELEARKRFDFIHSKLDPLYIAGNVAIIRSKVNLTRSDGVDYSRPLQGQSPWVVNLQFGYDDSAKGGTGLAASLLYNVSGERLRIVGRPEDQIPDQYEQPFHQLDLVVSQVLPHDLNLGFRALNLLNPAQEWTQGDYVVRRFKRGTSFALTLAWGI